MMHEFQHRFFQLSLSHLPMADDDPRSRHEFLQLGCDFPDRIHAIVDEINLSAAFQFLFHRRADQFFIPARHHSLNCNAIFRRRLDDAHVAQADHGHVQRPWDRCRGHGQDVHLFAHLL